MATNVTLPELGENIESGTVVNILVSEGDSVSEEQSIIEVETEKATVDVPSTASGTVSEIKVGEGDEINVGDVILVIEAEGGGGKKEEKKEKAPPKKEVKEKDKKEAVEGKEEEKEKKPKKKKPAAKKEQEVDEEPEEEPAEAEEAPEEEEEPEEKKERKKEKRKPAAAKKAAEKEAPKKTVRAAPSVRRLAREIGVDIYEVEPQGETDRITKEDIKAHARETSAGAPMETRPSGHLQAAVSLPNFERWGEVHREKMTTIRRKTAERMAAAWASIPHVTHHDKADITQVEELRKKYGKRAEALGGKLTVTAILVKVLAQALHRFPKFNTSIDVENQELIFKHYYNIGVAVDTDRGLLVPVIKDVDQLSIVDIAVELNELSEKARNQKVSLDEMQGSSMTITNLGGIGGTSFTPVVYAPEVAILAVSRGRVEPVYENGQFVPRTMLPLSLSYDHRVIDGADAARFTRWLCEAIENPMLMFLES